MDGAQPPEHTQPWFKSKIKRLPIGREEEICLPEGEGRRVTDDYCRQIEMISELSAHYPSERWSHNWGAQWEALVC